jgi:paraquat-inducible protein A
MSRGVDRSLGWMLLVSAGLVTGGWFAPVMTVDQLFFIDRSLSLFEGIGTLWTHGEYVLLAMVMIFSFLFPGAKILLTFWLWRYQDVTGPRFARDLRWIETLGKWSMLDVFVIALSVAAINISLIGDVHLHWGIYLLAAGVLCSMAVFTRLTRLAARASAIHTPVGAARSFPLP